MPGERKQIRDAKTGSAIACHDRAAEVPAALLAKAGYAAIRPASQLGLGRVHMADVFAAFPRGYKRR